MTLDSFAYILRNPKDFSVFIIVTSYPIILASSLFGGSMKNFLKNFFSRFVFSTKVPDVQPQSAEGELPYSSPDEVEKFFSCLRESLPAIQAPFVKNRERNRLTSREVLLDIRGKRRRDCQERTFQNNAGRIVTERVNSNGIVTYRKTERPSGEYKLEYFDTNGNISRKLWFYNDGFVIQKICREDGKSILYREFPNRKWWIESVKNSVKKSRSNFIGIFL